MTHVHDSNDKKIFAKGFGDFRVFPAMSKTALFIINLRSVPFISYPFLHMHLSMLLCYSPTMKNSCKTTTFCHLVLYLFIIIQCLAVLVIGDFNVTPYNPTENITIDCGSSTDDQSFDGRSWIGDVKGKFSPREQRNSKNQSLVIEAASPLPSSVDKVPYSTARLSYSEFTYSIPLTSGPKFIRLYFNPASYPGFDDSSNKAFFSVKAGRFTLLSNFSALLHAQGEATLVKEFCMNVDEGQRLNLAFTPSPDIIDSYAFINGIEVVSMPRNLYYEPTSDGVGVPFVGQAQGKKYSIENDTAFEKMYRINVGGSEISPVDDTGMFRGWLTDDDYLTISTPSVLPVNTTLNLSFNSATIPSFSAPREVYVTARSMGTNKTENENYYLTWEFPVDSTFRYFVRLHFCEFQTDIRKQGDRVFEIFLANSMAEGRTDVIVWSGGNGIPVYQDYVVAIGAKENRKQQNLSIALHPFRASETRYSDAILNGLEIFKLSNNFVLAGPNPDPVSTPETSPTTSVKHKNNSNNSKNAIFGIVGGVIAGLVVLSLLCFFIFRREKRVKDAGSSKGVPMWSHISSTTKSTKSRGSSLPTDLCRYFSLAELHSATRNFDKNFIIGAGGFGNVYKGSVDGGATQVAIKRLNPDSQQGAHEFRTEIEMLSQLRYVHLVSLIGYCNDNGEMILVYDYMSRGTLRDHLYNTENRPLQWKQRLEICLGAAQGLEYLHSGAKHTIIHRDVKTTNILLDDKWVAKVSDFGLSRIGSTNMLQNHVSTVVKGSFGYLDPEYSRRGQLTEKSDVYSFGVVLSEILCARPALNRSAEKGQVSLAAWFQQCHRHGTLHKIIDPFLIDKIAPACLKQFTDVVMSCFHDEGTERPSMGDVAGRLQFAMQLQEGFEEGVKHNVEESMDEEIPIIGYGMEDDSGEVFSSLGDHVMMAKSTSSFSLTTTDEQSFIKGSDKNLSRAVFSEIGDPQGR